MEPLRVYIDSSVGGGCLDPEFEEHSGQLIEWARRGELRLLISEVTLRELPPKCLEFVALTTEILALRDAYLCAGVLGSPWMNDAAHVAAANVARADAIVSWNFKHIVRLEKIKGYNEVNRVRGYDPLAIITPREVRLHDSDE